MTDEQAAVQTLEGLIRNYSPSGAESGAVTWLIERMKQLGYQQAFGDKAGNAVGVIGSGRKNAVLLGHIDTVRGNLPLRKEQGRIFGRGAVDAKGALAAFVMSAAAVKVSPEWRLTVIGAVDEERGSSGARFAAEAYQAEIAVIGEPNRWDRIGLGYKGSLPLKLAIRRPLSHTASEIASAAEEWVNCWNAIRVFAETYNEHREKRFDRLLVSLRSLHAGEDEDGQFAFGEIGCRLPPEESPAEWLHRLRGLDGCGALEPAAVPIPAWRCEKNTLPVRAFMKAIRSEAGSPAFVYKTGTADLNIVAPAWGCPSLVYGPGDSALDHTDHESLEIAEYLKSIRVLTAALTDIIGVK